MSSSSLQPILALLGNSLGGNPTQYMTEKAFRHHELDWRYLTLEVRPDDLGDAVRGLRALGFHGGNITQPYKEAVVALLERTSRAASLIGVVNVISRDEEGLLGENTEGKAMVDALRQQTDPAGTHAVVLGAGRMARAVAVELALAGAAELTVVARDASRAAELAELISTELEVPATSVAWQKDFAIPPETNLLIHATSLARNDPDARVPLALDSLAPSTIVADATIDPPHTRLLRDAQDRGCATVDGVDVLSRQTAINFRLWTGIDPDLTIMREAVEEFLEL